MPIGRERAVGIIPVPESSTGSRTSMRTGVALGEADEDEGRAEEIYLGQ